MQSAIVNCSECNNVLVNLPTGFGKSLIYQYIASNLIDSTIVVFVPLKALLWDSEKEARIHRLSARELND